MIATNNIGKDYTDSIRNGTLKEGLGIGCDLDTHLRYKQGAFNVFAGHANVGKTKFILYYFLCLSVIHKKKWLIFSSENSIGGIKRDLIQLISGQQLEQLTQIQYEHYFNTVSEFFQFIDPEEFYRVEKRLMNFRDVLKTALEECEDFDALVIDPYNSLAPCEDLKGNAHERDYQVASEFRMFCKQNNKSLYLLAHGNTEALRKVFPKGHDFAGHPIPLMASDIEGGGKWVNRADDFCVIHRLTQHESMWMKTEVHVRKVKETETGGTPTFMDTPVIFQMMNGGRGFHCWTMQLDFTYIPENAVDPLAKYSEAPKDQPKLELKPNEEFEVEPKPQIEVKRNDEPDFIDGIFEDEEWNI